MARKRLIKGANAARVEERIARVPADVPSLGAGQGASIFGVLKTMEEGKGAPRKPASSKPAAPIKPAAAPAQTAAPRPKPLAPADFTAAERDAIVRCCSDYRNHLPTYLLAVQKEVRVIDSVLEKCRASVGRSPKS